ncbi:testis-specific Y-encoded protein 3-like [Meles meles]|uniref:testis-specific Y-encoded protein 3-like n=1 Tax=Meles meles TaxID=9662 RepID=UPI001E69F718|nr:testis-specific Y-encoded protein 3-like [Meles meles]XP_045852750.1 testis-specific Y-encoded protein 3-like [Meles meles]
MAAEPGQEEEGRWEREDATLVVELVLVVDDLMLVWQLVVVEVAEGPGESEEEEDDDDGAREVESEAEEEGEAEEGEETEEEVDGIEEEGEETEEEDEEPEESEESEEEADESEEEVEEVEKPEKAEEEKGQEEDEEADEDEVAEVPVQEEEDEDGREEAWEQRQNEGEAQELQEKQGGEEQPGARPGPPPPPLQALEALQSELEPMNKDASRAYSGLKLRFCQRRRHHLDPRSALIRGIPGFWAKAFVNHPQMSAMISGQDKGILGSMTDLKVEDLESPRDRRKILLFFRKNSYFRNEVVEKEYVLRAAGYEPSHSTPIQWHRNYEREAYRRRHHNSSLNFFNWFSDHSFAGSSRIAEILMDDLWPNPLQYYVRKKAPAEGTERRAGLLATASALSPPKCLLPPLAEMSGELQHVEMNMQKPCTCSGKIQNLQMELNDQPCPSNREHLKSGAGEKPKAD